MAELGLWEGRWSFRHHEGILTMHSSGHVGHRHVTLLRSDVLAEPASIYAAAGIGG